MPGTWRWAIEAGGIRQLTSGLGRGLSVEGAIDRALLRGLLGKGAET
jgi:hypothetical protein